VTDEEGKYDVKQMKYVNEEDMKDGAKVLAKNENEVVGDLGISPRVSKVARQ
jgi:hypothetical protein